jgi:hypothetical protein
MAKSTDSTSPAKPKRDWRAINAKYVAQGEALGQQLFDAGVIEMIDNILVIHTDLETVTPLVEVGLVHKVDGHYEVCSTSRRRHTDDSVKGARRGTTSTQPRRTRTRQAQK